MSSASTTSSKKKNDDDDDERTWFTPGAFGDGYDFGDITKTILGTTTDLTQDITQGIIAMPEKIIDTGATGVAWVSKLLGKDEFASKTEDFIEKDLLDEERLSRRVTNMLPTGRLNNLLSGDEALTTEITGMAIEDNSLLGEKADSLGQSGGQLLITAGLQAVGVPWWLTTSTTSFGGEVENALKQDATLEQATVSAGVNALGETLTEKISGGISFGGKTIDGGIKNIINDRIKGKVANTLIKLGLDAVGEGTEEVLSEAISNAGKLSYEDKTFKEALLSEEAFDGYLASFIGGAVLGGGVNSVKAVSSIKTGRDYDTDLTDNEQSVIDAEIAKRTEGKELTNEQKSKIEAEVREDLEKGYISTDVIESTLGGNTYNELKSVRDNKTKLETQIKELENKPNAEITVKEMEQLKALREELSAVDTNTLESKLQAEMSGLIKSDDYLQRSYQEKAKRSQEFTYKAAETDSEFRKGVYESTKGKLNDTTRSHETAEALVKLSEDRKMQYKFTNNAELTKLGLVPEGKTANGLYVVEKGKKREI